ncbi:MAG: nucleotidyl transferase AbiEii/AbiGii toxin family protein [Simkaniaceae bacterium]
MNEQALKDRIKAIAGEKGIHFNECWKKLLLERFLLRLSRSAHHKKFIFKGGFLLAYLMEIGRETVDLDFLLTRMNASENEIKKTMIDIVNTESMDGFFFHYEDITPLEQPHMKYPGYRINFEVKFGRMKDRVHIDVGTGDIVSPTTHNLHLIQYRNKPLFESQISLQVYPPETIFAEKLESVISKGTINSRMKDYHDLLLLIRDSQLINFNKLHEAIKQTFYHRGTPFELIDFSKQGLKPLDKLWQAHLKNLGNVAEGLNLPRNIQDAIIEINQALSKLTLEYSLS